MIQKNLIREMCDSNTVYARGEKLLYDGSIRSQQCSSKIVDGNEFTHISAKVQGSGINLYQVTADLFEKKSHIMGVTCTCPAFYSYDGICKHCTAVLLNYIKNRQGESLAAASSASRGMTPGRSSSFGVSRLIRQYREKERLTFQQNQINGTIELIPLVNRSYGQLHVEFKIGSRKKYVLKNTLLFADALKRSELVKYGKELEFYHTLEAFTPESRPLAEFLLQEAENRRERNTGWMYYDSKGSRYISLHSGNMDGFFRAMGEQEFTVEMNYGDRKQWHISGEDYQPRLVIQGQEDGAVVKAEPLFYTCGERYAYLWERGRIYQMPLGQVREILPFWEHLGSYRYEEFFVAKQELSAFCQELLPVLKQHYQIEKVQFQEERYLPPKPEFEIYLDALDNQTVTCELLAVYAGVKYNCCDKPKVMENRDERLELKVREQVRPWFLYTDPEKKQMLLSGDDEKLYLLLTEGMEELAGLGTVFVSDTLKSIQVTAAPAVSMGISLKGDLLELTLDSGEMPLPELIEILSAYQRKRKFFRLKNGDFLSMEEDGLSVLSRIQKGAGISPGQWKEGAVSLPKYRALYLDGELREQNGFHAVKNKDFRAMIRNMKTVEDNDFEVPGALEKVLREYQRQGFLWLKTLCANGFGGILADDMGLGKTLQIIAFLLSEWEERFLQPTGELRQEQFLQSSGEPEQERIFQSTGELHQEHFALIVCPASLVYNWKHELERFAPKLSAVTVTGTAGERENLIRSAQPEDILITSYELLRRDLTCYEECRFGYEVIDEAQYIKNHNTKAARAVKAIRAGFRAALTGTPIENRLSELWSIFDYLMPGFLYPYSRFREELEIPIVTEQEAEATERLRKMIRPFVLRRLKRDVLKELPQKQEEAVFAVLEKEQEKLYRAHVQRMKLLLEGQSEAEFASQKIQILSELTRLRQLCCDPALVYENYREESAKMGMCMDLIKNALEGGHKLLLFSQFTTMLSRLQQQMGKEHISFLSLTGATSKEKRAELVEEFQKGEVPVFCISLKAGGTGLNLTAADIVIHYDPWWNVAVQNQATDRAHRIGQKNPVTVYKLIARHTIEENILKLQEKKSQLAEQLLGNEDFAGIKLTREELLELLG